MFLGDPFLPILLGRATYQLPEPKMQTFLTAMVPLFCRSRLVHTPSSSLRWEHITLPHVGAAKPRPPGEAGAWGASLAEPGKREKGVETGGELEWGTNHAPLFLRFAS